MQLIALPIFFAIFGFVFSTKRWIKLYDKFTPTQCLIIYYIIITLTIALLQYFGLVIGNIKFNDIRHTLGSILIIFSFFIIFDWESCYINIVTRGKCQQKDISNIYMGSEDGAVYDLYSKIFSPDISRIFTYIITPFILSLIGIFLIKERVSL